MKTFYQYSSLYRNIKISRDRGVITLRLHTDGGPLRWGSVTGSIHDQLGHAFRDVALDSENQVMVFVGTGENFCMAMDIAEIPIPNSEVWDRIMREGHDLLLRFLEIDFPVVSVLNGPATIHSELAVMGDVVLAADDAYVVDSAHVLGGIVPGDGVQTIWMDLLGPNRSRHFLFMGASLNAAELKQAGVVAEVLPRTELEARAKAVAEQLAAIPRLTAKYTRQLMTHRMKRRLLEELSLGMALEGLSISALVELMQDTPS